MGSVDYDRALVEMVSDKNLMNSYKLYFLKAILINVSKDNLIFTFKEMSCWMCAYSFCDTCKLGHRIRPLDKLYDAAVLLIDSENLMEASTISEVYSAAYDTGNEELKKLLVSLCNYVPYRLLAYMWPQELRGKTDRQKNALIEEMSRSEGCLYSIYTENKEDKRIEVDSEWAAHISKSRKRLVSWIDQRIESFVQRSGL